MSLSQADLARILQQPGYELVSGDLQRPKPHPTIAAATTPSEHDEQVQLFAELEANAIQYPELRLAFAIPNGGHRYESVAAKLKAEGVKAGVPDLFLPVARAGWHGLFIEMKRADGSNHATPLQEQWLRDLAEQGYFTNVAYGAAEALEIVLEYVRGELL